MFGRRQDPHASVYLLADHLEAIMAAGDDILGASLPLANGTAGRPQGALDEDAQRLALFTNRLRRDELLIAAHLRQARLRAADLRRADKRFASLIKLFLASTSSIAEALDELAGAAGPAPAAFDVVGDPLSYLRRCKVIDGECAGLHGLSELVPPAAFAIAGRIELGPLMDLAAAFLNSLDAAYDLYGDEVMDDDADDVEAVSPASPDGERLQSGPAEPSACLPPDVIPA